MSVFSKLCAVAAWMALTLFAYAQEPTPEQVEYQTTFKKGYDALVAGRHDEGIAAFQRCLELVPTDSTSTYNIACGYSMKGDVDQAFVWLDKAAELGFGNQDDNFQLASKTDPDLEKLRSDPRFAEFVAKMTARKKLIEEYYAKPAVYVPNALEGKAEVPLLVVLHDAGQTKESVIVGHWKAVADELGMALVAPSGKFPTAGEPANGMSWFDNLEAYVQRSWTYEKTVLDGVSAFQKERKLDRSRVVIAGEGQGGLLACSVGIGSPGLFKGVLALDAIIPPHIVDKAPNAGKMGLGLRCLFDRASFPPDQDLDALVAGLGEFLRGGSIAGEVKAFDRGEPDAYRALLVENVRALLPAASPVEAAVAK